MCMTSEVMVVSLSRVFHVVPWSGPFEQIFGSTPAALLTVLFPSLVIEYGMLSTFFHNLGP